MLLVGRQEWHLARKKLSGGVLERGADLHTAQLMPMPLTVSCISKIQIGFTFLVPAHPGSPGKRANKRERARVCKHYHQYCHYYWCIVCDRVYTTVWYLPVRLPSYRLLQQHVVGLLLWVRWAGDIDWLLHCRHPAAWQSAAEPSSVTFPAATEGWRQTCC